MLQIKQMANL